jgi:hypothetical protein
MGQAPYNRISRNRIGHPLSYTIVGIQRYQGARSAMFDSIVLLADTDILLISPFICEDLRRTVDFLLIPHLCRGHLTAPKSIGARQVNRLLRHPGRLVQTLGQISLATPAYSR